MKTKIGLLGLIIANVVCGYSAEPIAVKDITFTFAEKYVFPSKNLLAEIMQSGWAPASDATNSTTEIPTRITRDNKDYGALSNIVAGSIASITVTWLSTNIFSTPSQAEAVFRQILSSPTGSIYGGENCRTFTRWQWDFEDWQPSAVATIKHTDGQDGYLLLWGENIFGYRDRTGNWWLGIWHGAADTNNTGRNLDSTK